MSRLAEIHREKRAIERRIKARTIPHMWESGFLTGPIGEGRPLKVWVKRLGQGGFRTWNLHGIDIERFMGLCDEGVILDDERCAGMVTTGFRAMCLEDLIKLESWVNKHFA